MVAFKIPIIILVVAALSHGVFAQTREIDSLSARLSVTSGVDRLPLLVALADRMERFSGKKTLEYAFEGIPLAQQAGNKESEANLDLSISFAYASSGNYTLAFQYAQLALEIAQKIGNREIEATGYSMFGIIEVSIGQFSKALEDHLRALSIREELGLQSQITRTINNIGQVYHNIGQYDKAIEYYNRALEYRLKTQDTVAIITVSHNIGYSEFMRGRLDVALHYHLRAFVLSEKIHYTAGMGYSLYNLALVYGAKNDYAKALEYTGRAYDRYAKLREPYGMVETLNYLGTIYYQRGDYSSSIHYLRRAMEIAEQRHMTSLLKNTYELLTTVYEKEGNKLQAFEYYKRFAVAKDSLFNQTESNRIADVMIHYKVAQKQHEIELLQREKTISDLSSEKYIIERNSVIVALVLIAALLLSLVWRFRTVQTNRHILEEQNLQLAKLNAELVEKMSEIKAMSGLIPICANCKKIRNDDGYWERIEAYIVEHSNAILSHGICPDCMKLLYPEVVEKRKRRGGS